MAILIPRDDSANDNGSSLSPIYIAGISLIGAIVFGVVLWLTIRQLRKRSKNRRESERGAAFLSVHGVVRDGQEKESQSESPHVPTGLFSRAQLTPSVVLPDKTLPRPAPSAPPAEIIEYHQQSGNMPRPSMVSQPFSFALNASSESTHRPRSGDRGSWISFMSGTGSGRSRFSVLSSASSIDSSPTTGTIRKIRQVFSPVLPDELLVSLGEKLNVIQSFDDGWCVVGKEGGNTLGQSKSLFKPSNQDNNVEIGVVPAWCFLKPVVGLKGERPIRSSSLGITVQIEGPAFSSREEIMSWSNF
ncbi:hypothetical protein EV361DRAFT_847254 [Lentinula raphanica]|uniref:SH3 domain-containing protein n=1 Tax=Lentinula raphanica TaxID=153919 RepID=A0AA38UEP1_9AGAR|nr:hypothetical protein F5878DRAFT_562654 [Lentinula raphanica]KAJ3971247.1 hypothetical protein EV361DRAFT_847254 [Lentinula raphanica]